MANKNTYLPKKTNWFRLPEYVSKLIGAGTLSTIETTDATDLASTIALANANKAKINKLITILKSSSLLK